MTKLTWSPAYQVSCKLVPAFTIYLVHPRAVFNWSSQGRPSSLNPFTALSHCCGPLNQIYLLQAALYSTVSLHISPSNHPPSLAATAGWVLNSIFTAPSTFLALPLLSDGAGFLTRSPRHQPPFPLTQHPRSNLDNLRPSTDHWLVVLTSLLASPAAPSFDSHPKLVFVDSHPPY